MSCKNIPKCEPSANNGTTIPLLGFGTAVYPLVASDTMKESILNAIKVGYRHFDTAALYNSEKDLGEAVAEALKCGIIESRDELFITSKLWCSDAHPDRVLPALQNTLRNLGLEYLDLYLIHYPASIKPGSFSLPFPKEDILPLDYKHVWEAMEECQIRGLTKAIGVSNFSCKKLDLLLSLAKIPPSVNQVEMNPLWNQKKLREFCKEKNIHVTAYSPLGAKGTFWGTNKVMDSEVLQEIAKAKGKSLPQKFIDGGRRINLRKKTTCRRINLRKKTTLSNSNLLMVDCVQYEQLKFTEGTTTERMDTTKAHKVQGLIF